jgi:putative flippase GtrA
MTTELLSYFAGAAVSLLFSYVPGLSTWYASLSSKQKSLGMLIALFVTALGVLGLACAKLVAYVTCDQPGVIELAKIFIAAIIANQATYFLSSETPAVKAAKDARL